MGKQRSAKSVQHQKSRQASALNSDRYHQACFEAAIDAMLIADDQGHYVDANPAACELFGLPKEALLGRCIADFAQAEFDFAAAWQAFLAAGQERGEFRLVRPDGTLREVEYAATANVVPHGHLSILRDVSDRKQLEQQVQQSQQKLEEQVQHRTLALQQVNRDLQATNQRLQAEIQQRERAEIALECAGDGMWDWNAETNEVYFSHQWKAMLGYADDEIGNTLDEWDRRVHPDDRDHVYAALQQYFNGQTPIYQSEHRVLTKAGTWKWVLDRGKAVAWKPDGTPQRMIGTHVDITERKQLEVALQASQQKYQTLFEILPVGVSITDAEGNLIETNPASEHILGIPVTEQTQRTYDAPAWQMIDLNGNPMAVEAYASAQALREQRVIQGQEQGIIWPDGSIRWLMVSAAPIPLAEYGVAIAYVDISERKRLEHDLADSRAKLMSVLSSCLASICQFRLWSDGHFIYDYYSPQSQVVYGYTGNELQNDPTLWRSRVFPEDLTDVIVPALQAVCQGQTHFDLEYRFQHRDGSIRWIRETATAQWDANQNAWVVITVAMDISDRKQAEIALQASENRYRQIVEIASEGIWMIDTDNQTTFVNPRMAAMLGYKVDEMIGQSLFSFMDAAEMAIATRNVERRHQGITEQHDFKFQHKQGMDVWTIVSTIPIFDEAGQYQGALGMVTDISERKQLEQSLQASEAHFRAVFEQATVSIGLVGIDGYFLQANPYFCNLLGYTEAELKNLTYTEITHPDDRDLSMTYGEKLRSGEYANYAVEKRYLRKDGQPLWISLSISPIMDEAGHLSHFMGIITDISDRKQLEQSLQESEARFRAVFEQAKLGIGLVTLDGHFFQVNAGFCQLVGYTEAELKTLTYQQLTHPDDLDINGAYTQKMLAGELTSYTLEKRYVRKDGQIQWVNLMASSILDEQGNLQYFLGIATDINDRKQADEALRKSEERLRLALESARMGHWDWDFATNEVIWSASLEQIMGLAPGSFDRRIESVAAMMHPDDRQRVFDTVNRSVETGAPYDIEFRFIKPDGTVRWAAGRGNVVRDATGQAVRMMGVDTDITDRKEAEVRLQEREAEFRALAENTPDGILRCDRQLRYLYINPVIARLNQLPAAAILGKTPQELGWPDYLCRYWADAAEQVFRTGQTCSLEYTLSLPTGDLTLDARIVPEFDAGGTVASILVVARDITPLKQAQLTLLQQAERERILRRITQHIRQFLDLDQILSTTVQEVRQLLQVDRVLIYRFCPDWSGDIIAESVREPWLAILGTHIYDPCFQETLAEPYCRGKIGRIRDIEQAGFSPCHVEFLASFGIRANVTVPIVTQDALWGLLCVHDCGDPHDWQDWEVEIVQQITEQLAIAIQQSELHQQIQQWATTLEQQVAERTAEIQRALDLEAMLQRITERVRNSLDENQILETVVQELGQVLDLECCDTGIYNADHTLSTIAHEFTQSPHSAKGTTFAIVNAPHYAIYSTLFQGQAIQFCDLIPCPFRAEYQHLTVLACPILDDQQVLGDLWLYRHATFTPSEVGFVQQVSNQCAIALRQSRLYQAAQAQVIELERLNRLKDDFLSTVSHELRTPMSNIKMATQMLEISLGRLGILTDESTPINRYFNVLREEGQREINLINDLLDLTRIDAGIEAIEHTPIELSIYLPHLAEPFLERTRQQKQQFVFQIPADLPPLLTDLSYLERVLTELLQNACKYTPAQETITISAQATSTALIIRISNSGVEIAATERDRVFDRFYRIPNNDPWKHGGTGLGLALVKKLVERLGGNIHIESGNGQTTFVLTFPLPST